MTTVHNHVPCTPERAELLGRLGKHKVSGGGCLYINKLEDVDLDILETIIDKAYQHEK